METVELSEDGAILHIRIPMQLMKRGGKKVIINPDGQVLTPKTEVFMPDDPVVRALVKARRWQVMLESGDVNTIKDLAEKEKVDSSYLGRMLKLNSLAPQIVERILSGNYPDTSQSGNFAAGHTSGLE